VALRFADPDVNLAYEGRSRLKAVQPHSLREWSISRRPAYRNSATQAIREPPKISRPTAFMQVRTLRMKRT